jgi:hypothetical protein
LGLLPAEATLWRAVMGRIASSTEWAMDRSMMRRGGGRGHQEAGSWRHWTGGFSERRHLRVG